MLIAVLARAFRTPNHVRRSDFGEATDDVDADAWIDHPRALLQHADARTTEQDYRRKPERV